MKEMKKKERKKVIQMSKNYLQKNRSGPSRTKNM